jgi:hypothetical protein
MVEYDNGEKTAIGIEDIEILPQPEKAKNKKDTESVSEKEENAPNDDARQDNNVDKEATGNEQQQ